MYFIRITLHSIRAISQSSFCCWILLLSSPFHECCSQTHSITSKMCWSPSQSQVSKEPNGYWVPLLAGMSKLRLREITITHILNEKANMEVGLSTRSPPCLNLISPNSNPIWLHSSSTSIWQNVNDRYANDLLKFLYLFSGWTVSHLKVPTSHNQDCSVYFFKAKILIFQEKIKHTILKI